MSEEVDISIKCKIEKNLNPFEKITFGKYTLFRLPSNPQDKFYTELILNFKDKIQEGEIRSNPEEEGQIILSWLSIILQQKIIIDSVMMNNVNLPRINKQLIFYEKDTISSEEINKLYSYLTSLPLDEEKTMERYIRACEIYNSALTLSDVYPEVSFLLFVTAIECLSNKNSNFYKYLMKNAISENISREEINRLYSEFNKENGDLSNFISFIFNYFDDWKEIFTKEEFTALLKTIYEIRSSFVHGGEGKKDYLLLVSTLNCKCISAKMENKEVEIPGLDYLNKVINKILVNFLSKYSNLDLDNIKKLALQRGIVNLCVDESFGCKKGDFIFRSNIKHRK